MFFGIRNNPCSDCDPEYGCTMNCGPATPVKEQKMDQRWGNRPVTGPTPEMQRIRQQIRLHRKMLSLIESDLDETVRVQHGGKIPHSDKLIVAKTQIKDAMRTLVGFLDATESL